MYLSRNLLCLIKSFHIDHVICLAHVIFVIIFLTTRVIIIIVKQCFKECNTAVTPLAIMLFDHVICLAHVIFVIIYLTTRVTVKQFFKECNTAVTPLAIMLFDHVIVMHGYICMIR